MGNAVTSEKLTSCSTSVSQQPEPEIAVVTPVAHVNISITMVSGPALTQVCGRIYVKSDHADTKCSLIII